MHLQKISRYDFFLHLAVKTDQYFEPCPIWVFSIAQSAAPLRDIECKVFVEWQYLLLRHVAVQTLRCGTFTSDN